MSSAGTLRRLAQRSTAEREAALEQCELCGAPIPEVHSHVLELATRDVKCACRPCGLLFDRAEKLRLIPMDVRVLGEIELPWEELRLPVDIAFFFRTRGEVKCFYPSPMGPTESLLPIALELDVTDDVEALLVNRVRGSQRQWIVPIDACYELVGLIRTRWRGFTGGAEVWRELDHFFDELDRESEVAVPKQNDATHVKGIKSGNSTGNYERNSGHKPDGTSTAERSTGINPGMEEPIDPRMPNLSPA